MDVAYSSPSHYLKNDNLLSIGLVETSMKYLSNTNKFSRETHSKMLSVKYRPFCSDWCPIAKAPDHQCPQCWPYIHCIRPVLDKKMFHLLGTTLENEIIMRKRLPIHLRVKQYDSFQPPRIGVIPPPVTFYVSDHKAKEFKGWGISHIMAGVGLIVSNIGADVAAAEITTYAVPGYWCGIFVRLK